MSQAVGGGATAATRADPDPVCLIFSVENVDAAYAELQAQGVSFVTAPTDHPEWGLRTAHLRDPAGNLIELYEPRPYQPE
jgi:lactoylglutathione lyase